jgi:hypothetical protein
MQNLAVVDVFEAKTDLYQPIHDHVFGQLLPSALLQNPVQIACDG